MQLLCYFLIVRDHLAEFTSAVAVTEVSTPDPGSSQKKRSATSYVRVLFETLTKMAAPAASASDGDSELTEDYSVVIETLPDLYQCFLHQNRYIILFVGAFLLKAGVKLPLNFVHFRQEGTVSKVVEFKFLQKLLVLLDVHIEEEQLPSMSDSGAAVESHSAGAMETDEGLDLDLEQTLKCLLAIEDSERSSTKQQSIVKALTKCLELIWKYDVYQV